MSDDIETRIATFTAKSGDQVVIDEFQDCVCAYYYREDTITGHAWLFNVGPPSTEQYEDPPYQLGPDDCLPHRIDPPLAAKDFRALFNDENGTVGIYFRDRLIGIVWNDARPGKSAYASHPTRAALPFTQKQPD